MNNKGLASLSFLVGEWSAVGTHPLLPGTTFHGRAIFEWIEGGAFLLMHLALEPPGIPTSVAIFGSDEAHNACYMLYFDERGVSRKYDIAVRDNVWTWSRDDPTFAQRFTGTILDDGRTIEGAVETCRDGSTWDPDLALTYTRVS